MKYVLVDNTDSINTTVDLASNVGLTGARTYFLGIKKLDVKEFNKLWKIMTADEYDKQFRSGHRKPSSHPGRIEWWKDESLYLDIEKIKKE